MKIGTDTLFYMNRLRDMLSELSGLAEQMSNRAIVVKQRNKVELCLKDEEIAVLVSYIRSIENEYQDLKRMEKFSKLTS